MAELVTMPKLGFDMAEGILIRWMKAEDETVEKGEVLAEIETDKATVEVEAIVSGVVRAHLINEGTPAPVGTPIAVIGTADEEIDVEALVGAPTPSETTPEPSPATTTPDIEELPTVMVEESIAGRIPGGVRASPVARRLAAEHQIDLATVQGTGPGGRIVKKDVEVVIRTPVSMPSPETVYLPDAGPRPTERVPLTKLRSTIGRRMVAAKQSVPHFYLTAEIDAAPMMSLRSELNRLLPEEEKVSVNDFIVKASALALRAFPNLNATLSDDEIVRHGEVNVGVAVAVEDGLLTAVVRDADQKPLRVISSEVRQMVNRIREGRVRPDDIQGSTFTVSNLGMFDIDHFIAIINPPEAAILAIGTVQNVPVVRDGEIAPGQIMQCTLSADHRVTDGAESARWLQVLRDYLEHPLQLVI